MAHNFIKGIDWVGDATGQTALANTWFVSKSGNDTPVDGQDPNTPYLTVAVAVAAASAGDTVVVGSGIYVFTLLDIDGRHVTGDQIVIFDSGGPTSNFAIDVTASAQANSSLTDIIFIRYQNVISTDDVAGVSIFGCTFIGGFVNPKRNITSEVHGNKFVNCSVEYQKGSTGIARAIKDNVYINSSVDYTDDGGSWTALQLIENEYLDANSDLTFESTAISLVDQMEFSIIRGGVTVDVTVYADLAAAIIGEGAGAFDDCLNVDPLFLGTPSNQEFIIPANSPAIGAGKNNTNIGDLKIGNVQNATSTEFGVSPQSNVDTAFVSGELEVSSGTSGRRESASIDLGQIFTSPTIRLNANLEFFVDHTPDSDNTQANPNHLIFEADWAGNDGVFNGVFEKFRWNRPMQQDVNSKFSGEDGFVLSGLVDIPIRFIKVAVVPRTNYTPA